MESTRQPDREITKERRCFSPYLIAIFAFKTKDAFFDVHFSAVQLCCHF
jgi:hypothetical protein